MAAEAIHVRIIVPDAPWTRAMADGSVSFPDLTWDCVANLDHAPERFGAAKRERVDVGEAGIKTLLHEALAGVPGRAIPVFFGREHMQRNLMVRVDSPLTH